ncbi:glycerol-3-phosphate cytidylyltransferase [Paenibacillus taihuensis]|uniref:Glycerol-3-phosphate cytidylyltransferase n=1 Tax=Paenibacillus taihuensis TaxID=1156355 RepID=A0A3D9S7G9_9BACL|nr:Gfo/Idh/MocA family oxidoreductase [Paenibacillus taihuensis]REE84492.1 glycerol-3-phosphate cytidylyltransferase [Paenibacillus taihuensis]
MKKVITYGSFDLFHEGHYKLLKRAKELGDYLIVGVTTEQYDEKRGKMNVINSLMERIENIKATGFADEIIIEDHEGQKVEDIQKYGIDIFTVGSDWKGKFEFLRQYCDVVYLERTKGISSTMIRQQNHSIIRLGIIGSGRIAARFAPEVKYVSGTNLEGVYNPRLASASKFAEQFELKFYTDQLETFFEKIDAVYIASPHNTHHEYIRQSLQSGKHVLCEKPMVLAVSQAEEVYQLAKDKGLILLEGIKTAYAPGFLQLLAIARSGRIGQIRDVEASFTKLVSGDIRELRPEENGGSVTELASYPLLAIIKLLGTNYTDIRFESFEDENGVDLYTKIHLKYKNALSTAKVGLGVKSEGHLLISGTQGYIYVEAPWWKTQYFEVRHEDPSQNEKFFSKFVGEGLRYELSDFISLINGNEKKSFKLTPRESIVIAGMLEAFLATKKVFIEITELIT